MEIFQALSVTLLGELLVVVIGVLFANYIKAAVDRRRFGGWTVIVRQQGESLVEREISPRKAREVLDDPSDLVTFLKGVVSPYGWITCDLPTKGKELGLLVVDREARRFVIDLDRNPLPEEKGPPKGMIG